MLILGLPLLRRKRFAEAVATRLKRVEQHARLRLFGEAQGLGVFFLRNEQRDHTEPRAESVFKEALPLLFSPCKLAAHGFNGRDGGEKTAARFDGALHRE